MTTHYIAGTWQAGQGEAEAQAHGAVNVKVNS